jgi:hypothetical protein
MRSIRDILVHLVDTEARWIDHVIQNNSRVALAPDTVPDLEPIIATWITRRQATVKFIRP